MTKSQYTPCNTPWLVQSEFETTIVDSMDNELAQIFAPDTQEQLEMARLMGASPELLGVALSLRAICGRQANILSTASDAERCDFIGRIYELVNGDGNAAIAKATGDAI